MKPFGSSLDQRMKVSDGRMVYDVAFIPPDHVMRTMMREWPEGVPNKRVYWREPGDGKTS